jgi:hypothetical protein
MREYRRFGAYLMKYSHFLITKRTANILKKQLQRQGYMVRIVEAKGGYKIYTGISDEIEKNCMKNLR